MNTVVLYLLFALSLQICGHQYEHKVSGFESPRTATARQNAVDKEVKGAHFVSPDGTKIVVINSEDVYFVSDGRTIKLNAKSAALKLDEPEGRSWYPHVQVFWSPDSQNFAFMVHEAYDSPDSPGMSEQMEYVLIFSVATLKPSPSYVAWRDQATERSPYRFEGWTWDSKRLVVLHKRNKKGEYGEPSIWAHEKFTKERDFLADVTFRYSKNP